MPTSLLTASKRLGKIRCDALQVGMPKCGSTFLQHVGSPAHPEIKLIWEPGLKLFFELRDELTSDSFELIEYANRLGEYVESKIFEIEPKTRVVFSFEGFCGPHTSNRNDRILAETLYQLVGPTKVIFVVREQYKLLYSLWAQFIKEGGILNIKEFFTCRESPANPLDEAENIFLRVQYADDIESLFNIFGRENVGIFFFEDLVSSYATFMKSSVKIPKRKSAFQIGSCADW